MRTPWERAASSRHVDLAERAVGAAEAIGAMKSLVVTTDVSEFGVDHSIALAIAKKRLESTLNDWLGALTSKGSELPWKL